MIVGSDKLRCDTSVMTFCMLCFTTYLFHSSNKPQKEKKKEYIEINILNLLLCYVIIA